MDGREVADVRDAAGVGLPALGDSLRWYVEATGGLVYLNLLERKRGWFGREKWVEIASDYMLLEIYNKEGFGPLVGNILNKLKEVEKEKTISGLYK